MKAKTTIHTSIACLMQCRAARNFPWPVALLLCNWLFTPQYAHSQQEPLTHFQQSIDSLVYQLKVTDDLARQVDLLNQLAGSLQFDSLEKSYFYAEQARALADSIGYLKGKGHAFRMKGIYHDLKQNNTMAAAFYRQAEQISFAANDSLGYTDALYNQALAALDQDELEKAMKLFEQTWQLYALLNNKYASAEVIIQLAACFIRLEKANSAYSYLEKAKILSKELGNPPILEVTFQMTLGDYYLLSNNYPAASRAYERSLELVEKGLAIGPHALLLEKLGSSHILRNNFEQAETYLLAAQSLHLRNKDAHGLATLYITFASLYKHQGKIAEAKILLERADSLSDLSSRKQIDLLAVKVSIAEHELNFESALQLQREIMSLRESLSSQRLDSLSALLNTRYQIEMKERDNQKLKNEQMYQQQLLQSQKYRYYTTIAFSLALLVLVAVLWFQKKRRIQDNILLKEKNQVIEEQKAWVQDANQQLEIRQSMLEKQADELKVLNQTKDRLLSVMAHDLRAPINSLSGFTTLLIENPEKLSPQEVQQIASQLQQAVLSVGDLLENLLEWTKAQGGTIQHNPKPVVPNQFIQKNIALFMLKSSSKSITVTYEQRTHEAIFADPDQIDAIIRNLLSNALKFTPRNGRINIREQTAEGRYMLSIMDTGIGICQKDIKRILDAQEKYTTPGTTGEKGAGLGLALCLEFLRVNQGRLAITSELGKGSCFSITFPLAPSVVTLES